MYQTKVRESELPWGDLEMLGVTMKVLHKDEATGAMAVLTRMEPGASIPAHWHTRADETVYVLDGDFVEDGESYGPGSYFQGKAGTAHGPHSTVEGCTVLTHFSANLDFQTGPVPPGASEPAA
jgi:quercetin dioxygenase-like cupin family protein